MSEMLPPVLQKFQSRILTLRNYFTSLREWNEEEADRLIVAAEIVRIDDLTGGPPSTIAGWTFLFRQMEMEKRRLAQ